MRAAGVVLTYGRACLAELLAMVARQTIRLPTLVWVDDAPELVVRAPELVEVTYGARMPRRDSIGLVRRAAVDAARARFGLGDTDAILVLDDDDFYATTHFADTIAALTHAPWTGGLAMGLQRWRGDLPPIYLRAESGFGQHATWAMRLDHYDRAGGYQDEREEDVSLAYRMGFHTCAPHWHCTHVRRHHAANLSGAMRFDRTLQRQVDITARVIAPAWSDELDELERWCMTQR